MGFAHGRPPLIPAAESRAAGHADDARRNLLAAAKELDQAGHPALHRNVLETIDRLDDVRAALAEHAP